MMRLRPSIFDVVLAASVLAALAWLPTCGQAQTLRVISWNLGTNSALEKAVSVLKKEQPDIVLLQQIPDWKFCSQLAQLLKPTEYHVLVCSSWSRAGGQTAILSRERGYFSWYEPWRGDGAPGLEGGCAFATVNFSGRRIGLFSAQLGDEWPIQEPDSAWTLSRRADAVAQIVGQVASVMRWVTNRPDFFVIGGTFNSSPETSPAMHSSLVAKLSEAGFEDLSSALPENARLTRRLPRGTADYVFTRPGVLAQKLRVLSANLAAHEPVLCELELNPAKQIAANPAPPAKPQAAPSGPATLTNATIAERAGSNAVPATAGNSTTLAAVPPSLQPPTAGGLNPWWIAVGLAVLLLGCIWLLLARWHEPRHPAALIADHQADSASPSYVIVTPSSTTATQTGPMELHPIVHIDSPESGPTHSETWRHRALIAEQQAAAAQETLRAGLGPQLARWLKQKFVRKMVADRAAMIDAQNAAALQAMAVDQRLARIERQIQDQNAAYEQRIAELTAELHAARSENRELIRARIAQVQAEMHKARERLMAEAQQTGK
jgi:hypothetical protein